MTIQIEAFRDYVMIGTQRVNRPPDIPAHVWMEDWEFLANKLRNRRRD